MEPLEPSHEANRREREVGSYPENSIVGDSKDTKESTVPVRRRKRETWDLTSCNPLLRTINKILNTDDDDDDDNNNNNNNNNNSNNN